MYVVVCQGSGLPGTFLGSIEGISYLVLIAGFGSFLPRCGGLRMQFCHIR